MKTLFVVLENRKKVHEVHLGFTRCGIGVSEDIDRYTTEHAFNKNPCKNCLRARERK